MFIPEIARSRGARPDLGLLEEYDDPEDTLDLGSQLVNSGKFDWALEEIPGAGLPRVEDRHAARMALLVYNQLKKATYPNESRLFGVRGGLEDVQTSDLALPTKWALPIIRRIYPAIFDSPFFATQPMPGPLAYAFFMDFTREADSTDFRYAAPFLVQIASGGASGASTVTIKQSTKANPVILGTYQVAVGQSITFGVGGGTSETKVVNAVNRGTGVITITGTFGNTHAAGEWCLVTTPSSVGEAGIPGKAKMALTRSTVTAGKYMLAATWTTEAMEDAKAQLNLDIEAELVQALSVEIGRELFATILTDIMQGATGGNVTIAARGATNVQDYRYLALQPIYDIEAFIYAKRFHDTDTILAGVDLATNIIAQDQFHSTPMDNSMMSQLGVTHLGDFKGKWEVYKTPFLPPNLGLVFKKPTDWLHAGYVYMPYIPLAPMPLVYAGYNTGTGNYQNTDEWTRNIRTRAGKLLTVGDEYAILTQG
jgi:hypothetical protein